MGSCVGLVFLFRFREAHAAAGIASAEAARLLMSKHAVEAELKLMQAQVEPHFLFNTLASVQYLTETDPREAGKLLSHLIDYLRAALPQLRASSTTLGKEVGLAAAYLNILRCAWAPRLAFTIDVPAELAAAPVSAEPADLAGRERDQARRRARGGRRHDPRSPRATTARDLQVTVTDTGRGDAAPVAGQPGDGVGLSNVRERLAALYGRAAVYACMTSPHGTHATLSIPFEPEP